MSAHDFGFGYGYTFANVDNMTKAELAFCENLPHGSGIDYDWQWSRQTNGKLVVSNGYHGMDEYGGYVGTVDFSVVVDDLVAKDFRIVCHAKSRYWVNRWDLKEYLGELIYWAMLDAEKALRDAQYWAMESAS